MPIAGGYMVPRTVDHIVIIIVRSDNIVPSYCTRLWECCHTGCAATGNEAMITSNRTTASTVGMVPFRTVTASNARLGLS